MAEEQRISRTTRAQRNDKRILTAARQVFLNDADAPMSAVADAAGVGMAAVYGRHAGKEDLLRTLCADGLARYLEEVEAAVAAADVPAAFERFMTRIVDADTHTLTARLAGSFTPTDQMLAEADRANRLNEELVARAQAAGVLRADVTAPDLAMVFEKVAAVRLGDEDRTRELRRRFLAIAVHGLRPGGGEVPGTPPRWEELGARWQP
jgi:AcrR family transcriptional regulator